MTSLASRIFAWAWSCAPLTQVGLILAVGWAWVAVSAWMRAGELMRGKGRS